MDLNALKLKTSQELNDDEKKFLIEHKNELDQYDVEAYSDFLNAPAEEATEEVAPEAVAETPQAPAPAPEPEPFAIKSEEEARELVRKELQSFEAEKAKAMAAARTPEEREHIDATWKPQDWLHARKVMGQEIKDELKAELRAEKEQEETDKAIKFWQDQWDEVAKEKNLKPLTTPEGKKVHDEIVHTMRGYNIGTFKEGYELWEKIKVIQSGGQPAPTPSEAGAALAKSKMTAQKQAATKVGAANPGSVKPVSTSGVKPFDTYEDLKKASSRGILKDLQ